MPLTKSSADLSLKCERLLQACLFLFFVFLFFCFFIYFFFCNIEKKLAHIAVIRLNTVY